MRGDFELRKSDQGQQNKRARATASAENHQDWRLEPHVCAVCFSRVASRPADDGSSRRLFACTSCGLEAVSSRPACVCACGLKMPRGGKRGVTSAMVDMGVRCHPNAAKSPEFPALFVASYAGAQVEENPSDSSGFDTNP